MTRPRNPIDLLRHTPFQPTTTKIRPRYSPPYWICTTSLFSTSSPKHQPSRKRLRIGYVPEHFSTPLAFAHQKFGLHAHADLVPEPYGTGALASRLKVPEGEEERLDFAVGLTEGFVSDLGKTKARGDDAGYGLVGTYVESPLCWAISTGAERQEIKGVQDLKGKRVGVSRVGSGSYVMSYVLAEQYGWLEEGKEPFGVVPAGDFAALRQSVNLRGEGEKQSDFFMWEHFTTKHYWDNGELKRIGEIYTPWPSWMIAARNTVSDQMLEVLHQINQGVKHFKENAEESVKHITGTMHYSEEDAREWMKTVRFPDDVRGVSADMVDDTVGVLRKAGGLKGDVGGAVEMVAIPREGERQRDQREGDEMLSEGNLAS